MAIDRSYKVEYIEVGTVDITNFVTSLDDFSLQNNGKLSTCRFTLNAEHGDFMTNSNGGTTPILKQFDKIKVTIIDDQGISVHNKTFEITTDLGQLTRQTQYYLPIEMESRERNLKGVPFSGMFRSNPLNFHEIIDEIVLYYDNNASSTKQPILTTDFLGNDQNEAPKFNPNIWDFTNIDNCYDALMFVLNQMNLPTSAGGAGGRYAMNFIDDPITPGVLILRVLKQGNNNPGSIPTLQQNTTNPIMKIDKIKLPSTGTQVIARGRPKTGHLYTEYDEFISRLEFYRAIPEYDSDVVYEAGIPVKIGTQRYQAKIQVPINTPPPNLTYWDPISVGDYVGDFDYSPVTKDKISMWKNSWGNPEAAFSISDFTGPAIPDSNISIHDKDPNDKTIGTERNPVLMRTNSDDVSLDPFKDKYLWHSGSDFWIEGTQVLVDPGVGAIAGFFAANNYGTGAGNDPNGRPYSNSVVRYTEETDLSGLGYDWIVVREADDFDQVAVTSERRVYEYNWAFATSNNRNYPGTDRRRGEVSGTNAWRDITGQFLGADCFHPPVFVSQVDGLFHDTIEGDEPLNKPGGTPYIQNSGLKIQFGYNALGLSGKHESIWKTLFNILVVPLGMSAYLAGLALALFNTFTTPSYTTMGWWLSIAFPFARSTHNGVPNIGMVYGGGVNDINKHAHFDLFNSNRTVSGLRGFNQTDSDTLMEITGFTFLLNFDITAAGNRVGFTGNIPFTHWAMDRDGQMWKSPKKYIRKLGETDRLTFEYGELTPVFYPRTPLGISNVLENILVPEIQKNKVLLKENIVMQGVQCELPYDVHGRYSPNLFETIIKPVFYNFFGGGTDDIRFIGTIDAFNWIKTPIAVSKFDTTPNKRIITPDIKDYPNIVNIEQLQRYADAQEQIEEFQYTQFTAEQGGIGDLELEDSVYLKDTKMINDADGGANQILLTTRELHYSVPRNQGLIRKAVLVKVIT